MWPPRQEPLSVFIPGQMCRLRYESAIDSDRSCASRYVLFIRISVTHDATVVAGSRLAQVIRIGPSAAHLAHSSRRSCQAPDVPEAAALTVISRGLAPRGITHLAAAVTP